MWGMILLARTREMTGESKTRSGLTLKVPDGARILIVCDDDSDTERLKTILQKAGIVSECAKSFTAGWVAAQTRRVPGVVSPPPPAPARRGALHALPESYYRC